MDEHGADVVSIDPVTFRMICEPHHDDPVCQEFAALLNTVRPRTTLKMLAEKLVAKGIRAHIELKGGVAT